MYFVFLVNCVLKFVRFSTLLVKISITMNQGESFAHVKVNVNKINHLSTVKSFILTWISLLFCFGLA